MTEQQYNNDKVYTRKDMEQNNKYYLDMIQRLTNNFLIEINLKKEKIEENEELNTENRKLKRQINRLKKTPKSWYKKENEELKIAN